MALNAVSPRQLDVSATVPPSLNVGGRHDLFLAGTIANYQRSRSADGSSRLVIGPWAHGTYSGNYPNRTYGHGSSVGAANLHGAQIGWFDQLFKGGPALDEPPVRVFVIGPDVWRFEETWPPVGSASCEWYLRSGPRLSALAPTEEESTASIIPRASRFQQLAGPPTFRDSPSALMRAPPTRHRCSNETTSCTTSVNLSSMPAR